MKGKMSNLSMGLGIIWIIYIIFNITVDQFKDFIISLNSLNTFSNPFGFFKYLIKSNTTITPIPLIDDILFFIASIVPTGVFNLINIKISGKERIIVSILIYAFTIYLFTQYAFWIIIGIVILLGLIIFIFSYFKMNHDISSPILRETIVEEPSITKEIKTEEKAPPSDNDSIIKIIIEDQKELSYNEKIALEKCPECSGFLIHRKNSKDNKSFMGCTNYPNCHFAISYKKYKDCERNLQ